MKTSFYILLLQSIFYACTFSQGETKRNTPQTPKHETQPLLVLTGFSSEQTNISLQELKKLYCEGKIYVCPTCQRKSPALQSGKRYTTI